MCVGKRKKERKQEQTREESKVNDFPVVSTRKVCPKEDRKPPLTGLYTFYRPTIDETPSSLAPSSTLSDVLRSSDVKQ